LPRIHGSCVHGNMLALVGHVSNAPLLVSLDRETGETAGAWIGEFYESFTACFPSGNLLVALGTRGFYQFDENLKLVGETPLELTPHAAAVYLDRVLLVGEVEEQTDRIVYPRPRAWRVEVWRRDLRLLATRNLSGERPLRPHGRVSINDVGLNPATGEVWVAGSYVDQVGRKHSMTSCLAGTCALPGALTYPRIAKGISVRRSVLALVKGGARSLLQGAG